MNISQTFNFENFGAADVERLRSLGYTDNDLSGPGGLYGEQVAKGNIQPEFNGLVRLL